MNFRKITLSLLKPKGMSEAKLAELAGTSQSTIHRIKTGETTNPGWETGQALILLHNEIKKSGNQNEKTAG